MIKKNVKRITIITIIIIIFAYLTLNTINIFFGKDIALVLLGIDKDDVLFEKDYYWYKYDVPNSIIKNGNYLYQTTLFFKKQEKLGLINLYYTKKHLSKIYSIEIKEIKDNTLLYKSIPILNTKLKYEKYIIDDNLNKKILNTNTYVIQNDDPNTIDGEYSLIDNIAKKKGENINIFCGVINEHDKEYYSLDKTLKILYEDIKNGFYYFYADGESEVLWE